MPIPENIMQPARTLGHSNRTLFWAPRSLGILFILFVSMFALDVFAEARGFWQTTAALTIHLVPAFVLAAVLVVAWRWEWTGALTFTLFGIFFLVIVPGPWWVQAIFFPPCFLTALLFLANWWTTDKQRKAAN